MTYKEVVEEAIADLEYLISEDCTDTQHDYVGTIKLAIELFKKQIPMKPIDIQEPVVKWGLCPICKGELNKLGNKPHRVFETQRYCDDCGQALDWSEE